MADFPIFHGITLAANSYIENLNVEVLAADPVPVSAGRVWFNSTDKVFKFSGLDAGGAVIVRTFKDAESAAAELAQLTTDYQAGDAATLASAQAYTDTAKAEAVAYTDSVKAELLGGIPPETLDTITEIAAALRDNPDIVTVLETKIGTDIAAAKDELKGEVSEAMDTMAEIETAINAEIAARTAADTDEAAARQAADAAINTTIGTAANLTTDAKTLVPAINEVDAHADANAAALATETANRTAADTALSDRVTELENTVDGATGDLADLTTDAKDTLVAAINEVDAHADANAAASTAALTQEIADRTAADALIRSDFNAKRATFQSASAAVTHTFAHNLNSAFVDFTVMVQRADGKFRNDVVSVEEVDANTLKVYLSAAANVKLAVTSMAAL